MKEKIKKLINILNKANDAYYNKDSQIMSDFEYDKLFNELLELEKNTGIVYSNSPTINVGYTVVDNFKKVKHEKKMLSLDKTKEIPKLEEFLKDNDAILSFKLDGLTVALIYEEGLLKQAITRGNGEIGEDVTHNVAVFKNIPLKVFCKEKFIVRGEAVISFKDFEKINENLEDEEKYKNPRNLCSGTVRQLNNKITKERNVNFIAFSLIKEDEEVLKSNQLDFLTKQGFDIVEYKIVNKETIASSVKEFEKRAPLYPFATDGLVLTFNDIFYSKSLGETSKFPKDSIAFKWKDEVCKTKLLNVEWNVSRTGLINPIAIFEKVELEGTTVNRASLHNISVIKNLKLGIGDEISVYKANMIIPQIAENFTKSDNLIIPKNCPVCKHKTEVTSIKEGVILKCTNEFCSAKILSGFVHFVSRDAMNIEGLSEATIKKFIEKHFLKHFDDIYNLKNFEEEIINMPGFGEKSYQNIINSIENSKNVNLANFIYALGIEQVGLSNAKLLVSHFKGNLESIIKASIDDLIEIDGFGEVIAASTFKYFQKEKNIQNIKNILKYINIKKEDFNNQDLILKNKTFVITGSLQFFENRNELLKKIESLGGKVASSISKNTSYLINNDINSQSSKNKKAKELNIPILTEEQFLELIK